MFDFFSWSHILIMLVVALVVVGPKDLPRLMRMAAQWARKGRSVVDGLRKNFDGLTGSSELDGLRAKINAIKRANPLSSLQADIVAAPKTPHPPRG